MNLSIHLTNIKLTLGETNHAVPHRYAKQVLEHVLGMSCGVRACPFEEAKDAFSYSDGDQDDSNDQNTPKSRTSDRHNDQYTETTIQTREQQDSAQSDAAQSIYVDKSAPPQQQQQSAHRSNSQNEAGLNDSETETRAHRPAYNEYGYSTQHARMTSHHYKHRHQHHERSHSGDLRVHEQLISDAQDAPIRRFSIVAQRERPDLVRRVWHGQPLLLMVGFCLFVVFLCMYVCMYVCMCVYMYGCIYGWMDGWMDVFMDVCMYVCVCVCVCVCMYV
jgi:hypothetical protein